MYDNVVIYQYNIASLVCNVIFYSEWLVNQHRDSFASFIGHHDMVSYFALVENESKARIKFNLMQVENFVVLGCGININCYVDSSSSYV